MVAPIATAQPDREPLKYGQTRAILRKTVGLPAGRAAAASADCVMLCALAEAMRQWRFWCRRSPDVPDFHRVAVGGIHCISELWQLKI